MGTTAADRPEPNAAPEAKARTEKHAGSSPVVNKYAEVRLAKKKQRRKAHRKTIGRSNTGG
jgi:hypothetical protein